jgi:hypothetical protein
MKYETNDTITTLVVIHSFWFMGNRQFAPISHNNFRWLGPVFRLQIQVFITVSIQFGSVGGRVEILGAASQTPSTADPDLK